MALGVSAVLGLVLAFLALQRVGADNVLSTVVRSSPTWVLVALALFSTSMILRAVSWYQIVRAALPDRPVKRRTILSGTVIGVLMSATLPARLGEPSRVLIVGRRLGRMRETVPVLVGTLVSQTLSADASESDKAYIDAEVDVHKAVLDIATKAAGQTQNAELKNLIQKAAPVIKGHLDKAESIQKTLK